MLRLAPYVLVFAIALYAFIDCLTTDEREARGVPKLAWVFIILLVPLLGALGWLIAGRPKREPARRPQFVAPDDNPEFLASLKRSNDEHEDLLKRWEDDLKRRERDLRDDGAEGDGRPKE